MRLRTWLRYLIGDRRAILDIASHRRAIWVGLLFVLSAGFAREYDGEDLLHEPWHVVIPIGASLVASFLLFMVTWGLVKLHGAQGPAFFSTYRSFLGLFWLTAPLAWLYAIPYERFLDATEATRANLMTLGLVSLWRVLLMTRVVSVLMGYHLIAAFVLVVTFADAVALAALYFMPLPVIDFMGGIRHGPSERLLLDTAFSIGFLGGCSFPLWFVGALFAIGMSKPAWQAVPLDQATSRAPGRLHWLAWGSLAVWAVVLPFTQPEQLLRRRVERDLQQGHIAEALAEMSRHEPSDFPPLWDPPPRPAYRLNTPPLLDVIQLIIEDSPAPWVRTVYVNKLGDHVAYWYYAGVADPDRMLALVRQLPEAPEIASEILEKRKYLPPEVEKELREISGKPKEQPGDQGGPVGSRP